MTDLCKGKMNLLTHKQKLTSGNIIDLINDKDRFINLGNQHMIYNLLQNIIVKEMQRQSPPLRMQF